MPVRGTYEERCLFWLSRVPVCSHRIRGFGAMLRQNVQEGEELRAEKAHSTVGAEKGSNQ